jgi:predicted PurR-regulated permease PerM
MLVANSSVVCGAENPMELVPRVVDPKSTRVRRIFASVLALLFLVLFVRMVQPFFQALILAAVFSALLFPVYSQLRRRLGNKKSVAALATTVLAVIVVVAPLTALVSVLTREAVRVSEVVAPLVDGKNDARDIATVIPSWMPYRTQVIKRATDVINQTGNFFVQRLSNATESTVLFLLNLFVMLYAMFFLFLQGPRLLAWLNEYVPLDEEDKLVIARKGLDVTRATLKSVLLIGALQGFTGGIAFAFAGIPSAAFWGIVMAVASAIPSFGTALVWGPAALYLFFQGQTGVAIALTAWCAIVVVGLDNLARPYIVGNQARMPEVLVLLSTLGGLTMFGVAGIIIGPVLAGLFLTSLEIFAATFERDLKDGAGAPAIVDADGAAQPVIRRVGDR